MLLRTADDLVAYKLCSQGIGCQAMMIKLKEMDHSGQPVPLTILEGMQTISGSFMTIMDSSWTGDRDADLMLEQLWDSPGGTQPIFEQALFSPWAIHVQYLFLPMFLEQISRIINLHFVSPVAPKLDHV